MDNINQTQTPTDAPLVHVGSPGRYRFPLEFPPTIRVTRNPSYLIKGLLPSRSLVVLYGRPGSGKSFIGLDAALHVAAGRSWAGFRVRQAGVIYVASEGGEGMRRRVVAALRQHKMDPSLPFALITVAPDLGRREHDADRLAEDILAQVPPGFRPELVILDTLARSMVGGDETGAAGMGVFIESATRLGLLLGATIMPIHHMGKDSSAGMRGSSALLGAVDAVWEIDPDAAGSLRLAKMKDDADNLRLSFSLRRVVLDHDLEGDPITSCVVSIAPAVTDGVKAEEPPVEVSRQAAVPSGSLAFHTALQSVVELHGVFASRQFRTIPPDVKVMRQTHLVQHAESLSVLGTTGKSRQSIIDRHIRTLEQFGLVARHRGLLWPLDVPH